MTDETRLSSRPWFFSIKVGSNTPRNLRENAEVPHLPQQKRVQHNIRPPCGSRTSPPARSARPADGGRLLLNARRYGSCSELLLLLGCQRGGGSSRPPCGSSSSSRPTRACRWSHRTPSPCGSSSSSRPTRATEPVTRPMQGAPSTAAAHSVHVPLLACDSKFLRARIDTCVGTVFTQLTNIPSGFTKLLERYFCVFVKIIRIPSGFEELLDIITPKNKRRGANGFKRDNSVWWSWTEKA